MPTIDCYEVGNVLDVHVSHMIYLAYTYGLHLYDLFILTWVWIWWDLERGKKTCIQGLLISWSCTYVVLGSNIECIPMMELLPFGLIKLECVWVQSLDVFPGYVPRLCTHTHCNHFLQENIILINTVIKIPWALYGGPKMAQNS